MLKNNYLYLQCTCRFAIIFFCFLSILINIQAQAKTVDAPVDVHNVRLWSAPESTRMLSACSQAVSHKTVMLTHPYRLVLDIENAHWSGNSENFFLKKSKNTGVVKFSAVNKHDKNNKKISDCEITFELDKNYKFDIFMLKPNESYGHRLVIDLAKSSLEEEVISPVQVKKQTHKNAHKDFLVMIDPGHGGEDPGAVGLVWGTKEKDVVLSVSKKLQELINKQPGMRALLTRDGDYYLGLRKRMNMARRHGADIFISIHADSVLNPKAQGAATYVLSQKGASSEAARWLAEHENRADLIGGVRIEDKTNILASVLLDLSQTANQAASEELAEGILKTLGQVGTLHHAQVQRAGFMVLKAPDIPSVLIELGFLSHPQGEKKLQDIEHQNQLAKTIYKGIQKFLVQQPGMHFTAAVSE